MDKSSPSPSGGCEFGPKQIAKFSSGNIRCAIFALCKWRTHQVPRNGNAPPLAIEGGGGESTDDHSSPFPNPNKFCFTRYNSHVDLSRWFTTGDTDYLWLDMINMQHKRLKLIPYRVGWGKQYVNQCQVAQLWANNLTHTVLRSVYWSCLLCFSLSKDVVTVGNCRRYSTGGIHTRSLDSLVDVRATEVLHKPN